MVVTKIIINESKDSHDARIPAPMVVTLSFFQIYRFYNAAARK